MLIHISNNFTEKTEFWHFSKYLTFVYFQFPKNWPSHIFSLAVFPCQVPIPVNWLESKNIENSYHPTCHYVSPPSGSSRDPAVWTFYHGLCPKNYPIGLYKFAQNILIVDLDDPVLLSWLQEQEISNLGLFSYLSDLEYLVYEEFHSFLHYPIVMFNFKRFARSIDLKVKVFGMGHGVVPVTSTTTLTNVQITDIDSDTDTKSNWKNQIFFSVRCALKRDYFDAFVSIHTFLDSMKEN